LQYADPLVVHVPDAGCRSKPATKRADEDMGIRLTEHSPSAEPSPVAYGYLRVAEIDEAEISRLRRAIGRFCQSYRLMTILVSALRGVEPSRPSDHSKPELWS